MAAALARAKRRTTLRQSLSRRHHANATAITGANTIADAFARIARPNHTPGISQWRHSRLCGKPWPSCSALRASHDTANPVNNAVNAMSVVASAACASSDGSVATHVTANAAPSGPATAVARRHVGEKEEPPEDERAGARQRQHAREVTRIDDTAAVVAGQLDRVRRGCVRRAIPVARRHLPQAASSPAASGR